MKKLAAVLALVSVTTLSGCVFKTYDDVKKSVNYPKCRQIAMKMYQNNGFDLEKRAPVQITPFNERQASGVVLGCVVVMDAQTINETAASNYETLSAYGSTVESCKGKTFEQCSSDIAYWKAVDYGMTEAKFIKGWTRPVNF